MAWSGGKDCMMALERLRQAGDWNVVGLLTTVTKNFDRVAMHGIRRTLLEAQATQLDLPLMTAQIEWPSSNDAYEQAHAQALGDAAARWPGLCHCAYGDLYLADVRAYREKQLSRAGWKGVFPLWQEDTAALARRFIDAGHRATLVCVDTTQLDATFCGRAYTAQLLEDLPGSVDACGENGEFHTLVHAGPALHGDLPIRRGESLLRDGRFQYTDLLLDDAG